MSRNQIMNWAAGAAVSAVAGAVALAIYEHVAQIWALPGIVAGLSLIVTQLQGGP